MELLLGLKSLVGWKSETRNVVRLEALGSESD